jgi:hypothetical protein
VNWVSRTSTFRLRIAWGTPGKAGRGLDGPAVGLVFELTTKLTEFIRQLPESGVDLFFCGTVFH